MNSQSGADANFMGRRMAVKVSQYIGATLIGKNSNECFFKSLNCVIKTCNLGNDLVGITNKMHQKLDAVIFAEEISPNKFNIYLIRMDVLTATCSNTGGTSAKGKVTSYHIKPAVKHGDLIGQINFDNNITG